MSNETEKLTINLGIVELAQIDVLVEQGIFSNRSDFIRTSIRKQLENHQNTINRVLSPTTGKEGKIGIFSIGINYITKKDLEDAYLENGEKKFKISIIGMLVIDNDVSVELFEKTVIRATIRGKLIASPEIKMLIQEMK